MDFDLDYLREWRGKSDSRSVEVASAPIAALPPRSTAMIRIQDLRGSRRHSGIGFIFCRFIASRH